MKALSHKSREKGMALLVAMFTLVLLSVIGLGLMYSTNMETIINSNYRDKQVSMYGALSGLQEARDRLQPAAPSMPLPTDMPTLTNHQVFYIINPKGGETVAPWDLTNKYKDTELCQEGILGLTPTPGEPCNELPMGDDWYTVIDDSDDANEPWKSSTPLDTKWIRVTMKANNMTPVFASGTTVSTQTCWEGAHQVLLPAGYGPDCGPDGSIVKVRVTSGGTGYSSAPTVTFSAPPAGGTLATGTATITPLATGQLSSITVDTPGAGYTTPPSVSFVGVGSGATATAEIVPPGAPVSSVTLVSAGQQCYALPPTVSFSGGGSGATATATLEGTNSCVAAWTVTGSCHARRGSTVTGVGLSGPSGSGFSGSITFKTGSGNVIATSIQDPGVDYTSNPTSLTNLTGCGSLTVTAVAGARLASPLVLASGGAGYTTTPTVTVASGTGTAVAPASATATIGASVAGGTVSAIHLNTPGTGYTTPPLVVLTGGGLGVTTVATATANLNFTNKVSDIVLTDPGLGYTYNPTVTLSGGGGTGATATASRANGSDYGRIFLVTSMSQTRSGARSMAQAELASPLSGAWFPGALTLNGPNPILEDMPNSMLYHIDGSDRNSCSEDPEDLRPAIGGFDDPNADPPTTSVADITAALPRPDHYVGLGGAPSVVNIFGSLGETMSTPTGLKAFIDAVAAAPYAHVYGSDPGSITLGSAAVPAINYVDGDLTLSGSSSGYGILVVTGTLRFTGNFRWNGVVLAVGDGEMEYGGGGNPEINGTVFAAKIWDNYTNKNLLGSLGSPRFDWNGGGGNGIYYDHCWVENLIPIVPFTPPPSTRPLKILSTRTVSY